MSIGGTATTTRAVTAARTGLTARAKWTFTAFVAALLGLGLAPHSAQAAAQAAADSHRADTVRPGGQVVQRGTQAAPQPGTLPQTSREQHAPPGAGGAVLPSGVEPGSLDAGPLAATRTDRIPRLIRAELPEVRGPPTDFGH